MQSIKSVDLIYPKHIYPLKMISWWLKYYLGTGCTQLAILLLGRLYNYNHLMPNILLLVKGLLKVSYLGWLSKRWNKDVEFEIKAELVWDTNNIIFYFIIYESWHIWGLGSLSICIIINVGFVYKESLGNTNWYLKLARQYINPVFYHRIVI